MKHDLLKLFISLVGCQLVGIISSPITAGAIPTWYQTLEKPFFSPPNWLFAPAWITLYLLMGVSVYLIWLQGWKKKAVRHALRWFWAQLALNFLWTPLFFGLRSPVLGLIDIIILDILVIITIRTFYPISKTAGYLLVPYTLWISFATALNAAIVLLN